MFILSLILPTGGPIVFGVIGHGRPFGQASWASNGLIGNGFTAGLE